MSSPSPAAALENGAPPVLPRAFALWRSAALLVLTGVTIWACMASPSFNSSLEAGIGMELPYFVGNYAGMEEEVSQAEKTILPPDTTFARKTYRTLQEDLINCQIVMSGGGRRSIHRPEVCLPGQGWTISGSEVVSIPLKEGGKIDATLLTLTRDFVDAKGERRTLRNLFMYWFIGKNRTTPYTWKRILLTSWDRVVHNINHRWAYIIVSSPITASFGPNGRDRDATLKMMEQFVREIEPKLKEGGEAPTES